MKLLNESLVFNLPNHWTVAAGDAVLLLWFKVSRSLLLARQLLSRFLIVLGNLFRQEWDCNLLVLVARSLDVPIALLSEHLSLARVLDGL